MGFRIDTGIRPALKKDKSSKQSRPANLRARLEDPAHLALIRQLPCIIGGLNPSGEAAHIRYANAQFHKPITGIGIKPDDKWTVPLSPWFHTQSRGAQHQHGEEGWWIDHNIDPLVVASRLYAASVGLREAQTAEHEAVAVLTGIVHFCRREAGL
ncbi:hypothetical protein [Ancylobacter radicis]|uniref:Uncharacterized protein n=1 Tax=Ancylobacter radicis TaxID=2836179 RepID=A0ABS5R4N3_9HYPH|nr:hypothetical protein [Ancylobacter radicis]MBS9476177.1 hypothetical protein [Ancylobacter radicis]